MGGARRDRGFTLVEILIAIVLVGVLTAAVVVGVGSLTSRGSAAACSTSLDAARVATTAHTVSTGTAPTSFSAMVSSGAMSLPSGVTVGSGGLRLVGNGWQLVMVSGSAGVFACDASITGFPIDLVTTRPAAAFSLRRLSAAYTGPGVQVRRSSDNTTADIGFTATGDLDTAALLSFVGSGSGFVSRWYDQSGNGRDVTQATTTSQPRLVNAGVVSTIGTRPSLVFASDAVGLQAPVAQIGALASSPSMSVATVVDIGSASSWGLIFHIWKTSTGGAATQRIHLSRSASSTMSVTLWRNGSQVLTGPIPAPNTPATVGFVYDASVGATNVLNGVTSFAAATGALTPAVAPTLMQIGSIGAGVFGPQQIAEVVAWDAAVPTADRQTYERLQGTYFGVTVA